MTSIAVVIVSYNTCQALRSCLDSVDRAAASEVIVVDNASADGSVNMLRREYPWVKLYANTFNFGYGAAANQGIAGCSAPYVLLLNTDTVLQRGALEALAGYLNDRPQAAIVGPRLTDPDGTLQASCYPFPTPFHTFLENSAWAVFLGRLIRRYVPLIRRLYLRTWPHDTARVVPWVKGAAIAIRRTVFEATGGFDEAFFMYFEDADLCYRLKAAGWQVHFAPVTTVVHAGGLSTRRYHREMTEQLLLSTLKFYQKHSSRLQYAATMIVVKNLLFAKWTGGTFRFCCTADVNKRREIAADIRVTQRLLGERWRGHKDHLTRLPYQTDLSVTASCERGPDKVR